MDLKQALKDIEVTIIFKDKEGDSCVVTSTLLEKGINELEEIANTHAIGFAEFYLKCIDDGDEFDLPIYKLLKLYNNSLNKQ